MSSQEHSISKHPESTATDAGKLAPGKNRDSSVPGYETRIEQAELRTEQAGLQSERALRASELRYRRIFEAAKHGIVILDGETGRISDVNPFLVELLGLSHDDMVGKTVGELTPFKNIESNLAMLERLKQHEYGRYEDLISETRGERGAFNGR
jgi:PAS domain S-box-containing protein